MKFFKYLIALFIVISCDSASKKATQPPNVIIIFTDDQGYGDLGSFGSMDIKTPNVDALGADGATLTDFLVASSTCSPSRAALLTGAYPIRTGVVGVLWPEGHGFGGANGGKVGLHPNEVTTAEVLKANGYATAMAGKWHLGSKAPFLPTYQGFDTYFGIPYSNDMNRDELPILMDEKVVEIKPNGNAQFLMQFFTKKIGDCRKRWCSFRRTNDPASLDFFLRFKSYISSYSKHS